MATFAEQKRFVSKLRPDYTPAVLDALGAEYTRGLYDALLASQDTASEVALMQAESRRLDAWAIANGYQVSTRADSLEEALQALEDRRLNAWRSTAGKPIAPGRMDGFDATQPQTAAGMTYARQQALLSECASPEIRARLLQGFARSKAAREAEEAHEDREAEAAKVAEYERKVAPPTEREKEAAAGITQTQARGDSFEAQLRALEDKRQNAWRTG